MPNSFHVATPAGIRRFSRFFATGDGNCSSERRFAETTFGRTRPNPPAQFERECADRSVSVFDRRPSHKAAWKPMEGTKGLPFDTPDQAFFSKGTLIASQSPRLLLEPSATLDALEIVGQVPGSDPLDGRLPDDRSRNVCDCSNRTIGTEPPIGEAFG